MEKNGRNSCTGNLRHISIRNIFAKYRVNKEELIIEYWNTLAMLVDYFAKPSQGSLFRRLREVVMGWTHVDTLCNYAPPPKKECIENYVSGDEPYIPQKATYTQIVSGNTIKSTYGSWW